MAARPKERGQDARATMQERFFVPENGTQNDRHKLGGGGGEEEADEGGYAAR